MLTLSLLRRALLMAAMVNYDVLLLWFIVFRLGHDPLYRLHARWFEIPVATFDAIHFAGMAFYNIGILLLCVVPWLALLGMG
jgi:hypothetical protein